MVSSIETIVPGTPVNCSATAKGCDQETLYTAGTIHQCAVGIRKFFHTEDRDNILQLLVALENLLYALSYFVMLLTYDMRSRIREVDSNGSTAG